MARVLADRLVNSGTWGQPMRAVVSAFVGLAALAAVSARAAPITMPAKPLHIEAGTTPPIELVRQGCGWGWHRAHWRDRWGYWHWGHCVPNWCR